MHPGHNAILPMESPPSPQPISTALQPLRHASGVDLQQVNTTQGVTLMTAHHRPHRQPVHLPPNTRYTRI
jgi:hypothetical protein